MLRLYVWTNFRSSYGQGLGFALAESLEQARELLIAESGLSLESDFAWEVMNTEPDIITDQPFADYRSGCD